MTLVDNVCNVVANPSTHQAYGIYEGEDGSSTVTYTDNSNNRCRDNPLLPGESTLNVGYGISTAGDTVVLNPGLFTIADEASPNFGLDITMALKIHGAK